MLFVLVLVSLHPSQSLAREVTNLDRFDLVVDSLLQDFAERTFSRADTIFTLRQMGPATELGWFFEKHLIEVFGANQSQALFDKEKGHPSFFYAISYKPVNLRVQYSQRDHRRLDRKIFVDLYLRIEVGGTTQVLWSGNLQAISTDVVEESAVTTIENPYIGFTLGTRAPTRAKVKLLGATAISVVVGTVVYAFYAIRSR